MASDEDRPTRSIAKAATYRLGAFVLDLVALYVITGKVHVALGYAIAINACAFVGYYVHERIWSRVHALRRPRHQSPHHRELKPRVPRTSCASR